MTQSTTNKQLFIAIILCLCISGLTFAKVDYSPSRTCTNVTFALNTVYQPSTTRDAMITCGASITSTLSLSGGQSGTLLIQTSPDNVTYTTVATMINNNTGSLTIGLNTSQAQAGSVSIMVCRGSYFKMVSSGTSTFVALAGQQTLF